MSTVKSGCVLYECEWLLFPQNSSAAHDLSEAYGLGQHNEPSARIGADLLVSALRPALRAHGCRPWQPDGGKPKGEPTDARAYGGESSRCLEAL
jgi:hypothetical protein